METLQVGDSLTYFHCDASVPPPGHMEYEIRLNTSGVELCYWPDYPVSGCHELCLQFEIPAEEVASRISAAYHLSHCECVFREDDTGNSRDWVTGIYGGEYFKIPAGITGGPVLALFAVLKALVPEEGWKKAAEHRRAYRMSDPA
jgi:hypothetical protein